ncbi:MAG: PQQ-binding-like beta-propeller repeat protein [Halobacteriota archaeon]
MRPVTVVAVVVVIVFLGGVAALGVGDIATGDSLSPVWISDTGRDISANHHAAAVADGRVFAPISGADRTGTCALVALDASDGGTLWDYPIPPANCTVHSVADPAVADYDDDGVREVIVATTEREVAGFDPETGTKEFAHPLADYGYTQPVVADLAPESGTEISVVDVTGTVSVRSAEGDVLWQRDLENYVWAQPVVDDFDADGAPDLLVGGRDGNVTLFAGDGTTTWRSKVGQGGSVSWLTTGQADEDLAREVFVATVGGSVTAVDGATGDLEWTASVGDFAAVGGFGDGDADGTPEVYVVTKDGRLRSVDATTGTVEWTTTVTTERVQMMPPPSLADLDGDGDLEIVAPGNDGTVSVVDPETGDVLADYNRDVPIFTHATLADVDGDDDPEAMVVYADGRVVALEYESG